MMGEIERKLKRLYDVIGRASDHVIIEAVIMAFLGPLTRQHTVALHTSSRSCAELKTGAMDFTSVSSMNNSARGIGREGHQMSTRAGRGDADC